MKYKHKKGQKLAQSHLTLILKLKVTKKLFFGKPTYDFLYDGNVHKRSILKDKKILSVENCINSPFFLKSRLILLLGKKSQFYLSVIE